jgi:hypothetical protein
MKWTILMITSVAALAFQSAANAFTFGDLGPRFDFVLGDGGGMPADVPNSTGQQNFPDGVKIWGSMGPIDGARWGHNFVLYWSGLFEGPINPGDKYVADITFDAHATGGSLAWRYLNELFVNESTEREYISTPLAPVPPSGQVTDYHVESPEFTDPGQTGYFAGYLLIDWTGFSPTDTFTINVPQNSIDVTFLSVPEPNALLLALICVPVICARRLRRRNS